MQRQLSGSDSGSRPPLGFRRWLWMAIATLAIVGVITLAIGYTNAASDPVVRHAYIRLPDWPVHQRVLRIVLASDIHVAGPDMPPKRVERLVGSINQLHPDVVMLAGDFVSDKRVSTHQYSVAEAIAPLKGLRPSLGTVAVLGNHDHWRDAVETRAALSRAGITVLSNNSIKSGPLVIGGLDDDFTGNSDLRSTITNMQRWNGPMILLSHTPDPFPDVPDKVRLMLAGHTHCGQIVLPWAGALATMSRYGDRYACGLMREGGKTLIVGAGIGTSILPLRFEAPPDLNIFAIVNGLIILVIAEVFRAGTRLDEEQSLTI